MITTGDQLLKVVRGLGNELHDPSPRYAAHEAYHALRAEVPLGEWYVENIHESLCALFDDDGERDAPAIEEARARAVEQLVCRKIGVRCGSLESWAGISIIEGRSAFFRMPDEEQFVRMARKFMRSPMAARYANRILALDISDSETPASATVKPNTVHQCRSCPWRIDCVPERDIPNGYSCALHENLRGTIADGASIAKLGEPLRVMACHYSKPGAEHACAGWIHHQIGDGNNIPLRIAVMAGRLPVPEVDGPQHETFDDTLPKPRKKGRRQERPLGKEIPNLQGAARGARRK